MKFLLTAINAKYIHSNLAVYCLKDAAGEYTDNVWISEYTINNQTEDILEGIFESQPDVLAFSCYIWNISMVCELIEELGRIMPDLDIWLGGPEVSYNAKHYVEKYKNVRGVMKGEGEQTFRELLSCYVENRLDEIDDISGITTARRENPWRSPINLNDVRINYVDRIDEHRIIYYESSRGCPFSCSYCLSSVDKKLRFKDIEIVKEDLKRFLELKVLQVKFIDRTFNCKKEHALEIWRFINQNDNGITNFHFEIAADILDDEEIEELKSMRPGLVQLEIGVQTTNPDTISAIHRNMNLEKLKKNVLELKKNHNIHLHLDLIAGLPYEDIKSFEKSFNDIYKMEPDELQLGFLKLLYGSLLREEKDKYGIVARDVPPYEVLFTKWLPYGDVITLKQVENVLDMFYNSQMFYNSLRYLIIILDNPFKSFLEFGKYYAKVYMKGSLPSKNGKYDLIYDFASGKLDGEELSVFSELLRFDMFKRDNVKNYPAFCEFSEENDAYVKSLLQGKRMTKAEHMEAFEIDVIHFEKTSEIIHKRTVVHFDYSNRSLISNDAVVTIMN